MPQINPSDSVEQFRDPVVSMFQSAAAATDARSRLGAGAQAILAGPQMADHASPIVQAVTRAARALSAAGSRGALAPGGSADVCAHAYLALAQAMAREDAVAIATAKQNLPKFGVCDAGWTETISEFLLHYNLVKNGKVPYRRWANLGDFVLDTLPNSATIAVIGDWGTGTPRAQALLQAVAMHHPDIVIHLGDIYYSCDAREADAFFNNVSAILPMDKTRIFTLCGNHDMYGGGVPYYALLSRLGQPSSFFCLRNANWQMLAMDTGFNDFDPFRVNSAVTWVQDGTGEDRKPNGSSYSELNWQLDKITTAAKRKTVLLSHHPLFTRNSPIDMNRSINQRMLAQLQGQLANISLWLWGHEHNQVIYRPFAGLQRGRCIGASAIPVSSELKIYDPGNGFAAGEAVPELVDGSAGRLAIDAPTGLYDLGYGIMTIAGAVGQMSYYTFNETQGARLSWEEHL